MRWNHHAQLYELKHKDTWDQHKYYARIPTGNKKSNKYRYFYTKDEYQAYLNSKKSTTESSVNGKNDTKTATMAERYRHKRYARAGKNADTEEYQRLSTLKYGEFVDAIKDGYAPFNDFAKISGTESIKDAKFKVNPNYNEYDMNDGYEINCAYCSFAYDLRRRGFDVEARANTGWQSGTGVVLESRWDHVMDKWYKKPDASTQVYKSDLESIPDQQEDRDKLIEKLQNELENFGDGARGILCVEWFGTGGASHAVSWEIESGKLRIIDAQSARELLLAEYVNRGSYIQYIRTDNLEPSPYVTYMMKTKKKGASKSK